MKNTSRLFTLFFALFTLILLSACGTEPHDPLAEISASVAGGTAPDFNALHDLDPDIIAWLYIPGTDINRPVYRTDEGIHLDPVNGSVSAEAPAILLLGSSEGADAPFRSLQHTYSVDASLRDASAVLLYTPDGLQSWRVFGAGAFRDIDILSIYDSFRNPRNIPWFVDEWQKHHTLIRILDPAASVTEDDRLLILSTELNQTPGQRFLVLALSVDTTG